MSNSEQLTEEWFVNMVKMLLLRAVAIGARTVAGSQWLIHSGTPSPLLLRAVAIRRWCNTLSPPNSLLLCAVNKYARCMHAHGHASSISGRGIHNRRK